MKELESLSTRPKNVQYWGRGEMGCESELGWEGNEIICCGETTAERNIVWDSDEEMKHWRRKRGTRRVPRVLHKLVRSK